MSQARPGTTFPRSGCPEPRLTVEAALREGQDLLSASPSAALDAELLLGHVLRRPRTWILAHSDATIPLAAAAAYRDLLRLRAGGRPVAHLRGCVEWFGLDFEVTPDVLVPRPETEFLVEQAMHLAKQKAARSLADIGTGSGAIATALALQLPGVEVVATDRSTQALAVAARNLERHAVSSRVTLLHGNLLEPLSRRPDLIVANLPYLSSRMMESLDREVRFEPELALHGGPSGLELYEELLAQMEARDWHVPLVLEIDPRQQRPMRELLARYHPGSAVSILADYAGHPRIVSALPGGDVAAC